MRAANAKTEAALRDGTALGASHVFGERVDDLTETELRLQPAAGLAAAKQIPELPEFEGRDAMKADLETRGSQQDTLLKDRDAAELARAALESPRPRRSGCVRRALQAQKRPG